MKCIKFFGIFLIQTNHLIPVRRPHLMMIRKNIALSADHRMKIKDNENIDRYLDLAREQRKLSNMKVMVILIVVGTFWTVFKCLEMRQEELEIRGRVTVVEIGKNTGKSPADLMRLNITQTSMRDSQLTQVWRIH